MDLGGGQGREAGKGTAGEDELGGQGMGSCPARLTLGGTYRRRGLEDAKIIWGRAVKALNSKLGNV